MAVYEVMVNGQPATVDTAKLGLPENASPKEIEAAIKLMLAGAPPTRPAAPKENTTLGAIGKGMRDPFLGLGQLGARAIEFASPLAGGVTEMLAPGKGRGVVEWAESNRKIMDAVTGEDEEEFQKGVRPGSWDNALRMGGSALAMLPMGAASVGRAGIGALAREGAVMGGIGGASMPVTDPANFLASKGIQTAGGVLGGAVAGPVAGKAMDTASGLTRRTIEAIRARSGASSGVPPQEAARMMLERAIGPEQWAKIGREQQEKLVLDAAAALQTTGRLDPAAAARRADFSTAGIQPMKPWVTGDPVDFTAAHNAAGILPSGAPLQRVEQAASQRMGGMLDEMRPQGAGADAYAQGSIAGGAVQAAEDAAQARIDQLYKIFAATAKEPQLNRVGNKTYAYETPVGDAAWVAKRAAQRIDDEVGLDLPEIWARKLAQYGEENPFTPAEIHKRYKAANKQASMFPNEMRILKETLLEEMERIAANATGPQRQATAAARANFQRQDAVRAFADASENAVKQERFFDSYVFGGNVQVREFAQLWREMGADPVFVRETRAAAVDRLKKSAFGTQDPAKGAFALDRFQREIQQPGMKQKLRMILGNDDYSKVLLLERLAKHMQAPAGNKANRSNTGAATITFAQRILRSLGGGSMTSDLVRAAAGVPAGNQAQRLATAEGVDMAQRATLPQLPDDLREALARAIGGAAGAGVSNYFGR